MIKKSNAATFTAVAVSLLAIGAGCGTPAVDTQVNVKDTSVTTTATTASVIFDGRDDLNIAASVQSGGTKVGTKFQTSLNYDAAMEIYGKTGGYRFQLVNCSGTPGSFIIKKGSKFMLDNRDDQSHKIGIGDKIYTLAAYDFAIVSVQKPSNYNITCDGGGAGRVDVQD